MKFREWLWRRKWSTVSKERIAEIIAEIAPRYGVKYVAFRSDSPDGIVRPKDTLDVYVVNNGGMSYCDLAHFSGEVMCAMNRDADFHPMGRRTERSELEKSGYTIAFEEPTTTSNHAPSEEKGGNTGEQRFPCNP